MGQNTRPDTRSTGQYRGGGGVVVDEECSPGSSRRFWWRLFRPLWQRASYKGVSW